MEQTLVFEDSLINRISKLTIFDQFAQTIFVEDSHGVLEVEKSYRESNTIKFIRTEIAYQLKTHKVISKKLHSNCLIISDIMDKSTISVDKSICKCVSSNLNKLLIQELKGFKESIESEFNLFSQNIFQKIFSKNTNDGLIEKFIKFGEGTSWAIIPYNLLHIFYNSSKLELNKEDNDKIIYHLGKIENIDIYVNPDDESGKIFYGNFDSILILANKYVDIVENNQGTNYNFQYLFIEQGPIKSLQVK
jgi:hypothetical protein